MASNTYIELERLITTEQADNMLERSITEEEIIKFQNNHPIIGFVFYSIIKAYYTFQNYKGFKEIKAKRK